MTNEPQEQDNNRNEDGTFKEGVSGNPGGRPQGISIKAKILMHLKNNPDRLDTLVEHYLATESDTMRKLLWEMIDGKPQQTVDTTVTELPTPIMDVTIPKEDEV